MKPSPVIIPIAQKQREITRIPELDGVRGLAILLVLIWHYGCGQIQTYPGSVAAYGLKFLSLTWAGVDLFFVLSGFLIGGILIDNKELPNYFKAFYVRRICRIFPLYYLVLIIFFLVATSSIFSRRPELSWLIGSPFPMWSYSLYLQNFVMAAQGTMGPHWLAATWSLAVEEQFYLLLPLLIRFVALKRLPWMLLALVAAAPVFRTLLFATHLQAGFPGYVLLFGRWDALFLGTLGAYAVRQPNLLQRFYASLNWVRVIVIICALITVGMLVKSQGIGSAGMSFIGHTVLAVLCLGVILLATLSPEGHFRSLFRNQGLIWLGTVSYGIYLFHEPVSGLLHGIVRHQAPRIASSVDLLVTLSALALTLSLAAVSWRYFERSIVAMGQKVKYH